MAEKKSSTEETLERAGLLAERVRLMAQIAVERLQGSDQEEALCMSIMEAAEEIERIVDSVDAKSLEVRHA